MKANSTTTRCAREHVRALFPCLGVLLIAACGGGDSTTQPKPNETPPPVASVALDRTVLSIEQAKSSTLVATVRDATGAILTGRSVAWSSDANGIAAVSQGGVVTAVAVGTANITATSEGKSASARITVTPIPVATIQLSSTDVALDIGETETFTAETRAANGQVLTGRNVVWAAADNTVVSIADGVVTALAPGTTTISATSEGKIATATVMVNAPPTCASTVATGRLVGPNAQDSYVYTTLAGWTITISHVSMKVQSTDPGFTMYYEYWGENHENIGGKHIKDLLGDRRTILLPGGVVVTVHTAPIQTSMGWAQWISIYEGHESHRLDMKEYRVVQSCELPMFGEADEHDGETASIYFNETGMRMENVYQQDASPTGVPLQKIFSTVPLAQTSFANAGQVMDLFDDPRLGHTW